VRSILVTGGAGFIGSNFVHHIINKYPEYHIVVLDALTYAGNLENLSDLKDDSRFSFHHGNICDEKIVNKLMQKVGMVVNFAAETHVDRSIHEAGTFIDTDVRGTFVLLEAAKKYQQMKSTVQLNKDLSRKVIILARTVLTPPQRQVQIFWYTHIMSHSVCPR
jgi:dTDP-glucose 4,6-dehydratase